MTGNGLLSAPTLAAGGRQTDHEFRAAVPACLDAVEDLLADFRLGLKDVLGSPGYFSAELLLREALTNAVVHGSRCDPVLIVRCAVRANHKRLVIAVEDQGGGFDWRDAREREAEISACSGRGMEIFRKFASRVRFNRRGNGVVIQKFFDEGVDASQ
jgi:anti-sigma regulatory factor (Ser/Thr protein kinase)